MWSPADLDLGPRFRTVIHFSGDLAWSGGLELGLGLELLSSSCSAVGGGLGPGLSGLGVWSRIS